MKLESAKIDLLIYPAYYMMYHAGTFGFAIGGSAIPQYTILGTLGGLLMSSTFFSTIYALENFREKEDFVNNAVAGGLIGFLLVCIVYTNALHSDEANIHRCDHGICISFTSTFHVACKIFRDLRRNEQLQRRRHVQAALMHSVEPFLVQLTNSLETLYIMSQRINGGKNGSEI